MRLSRSLNYALRADSLIHRRDAENAERIENKITQKHEGTKKCRKMKLCGFVPLCEKDFSAYSAPLR